jgi:ABC-2 type transport system permease protein
MRRIAAIARKDLRVALRDRAALVSMLLVPLLLALILGMAFGSFGGSHSGLEVLIVDKDGSALGGQVITRSFQDPGLASLLTAKVETDEAAARRAVDGGTAVAVIVPPGAGQALTSPTPAVVSIEVYANPVQPLAAGIVRSIADGILARMNTASTAGRVTAVTLLQAGILGPSDQRLQGITTAAAGAAAGGAADVQLVAAGTPVGSSFDYGKTVGPSFAVLFLMFTTTAGARKMVEERETGTLARLLVSPSRHAEILLGKGAGMYVVGAFQMTVLLLIMTFVFSITWSSVPALIVLTAVLVFAASAWGLLLAGFSRTAAQANQAGTAMTIVFGIIAGNFVPRAMLPAGLQNASLVTPNGLGLEGYQRLVGTGDPVAIVPFLLALVGTGAIVIAIGLALANRRLETA